MILEQCPACKCPDIEVQQTCGSCGKSWFTANEDGDIDAFRERIKRLEAVAKAAFFVAKVASNAREDGRMRGRTEEFQDFIIHTHELLAEPLVELEALGDPK